MQFQYNDGGRTQAGYKGSTGDCVTRAIAIATGKPYTEVYGTLALGNATQRRGKHERNSKAGKRTASKGIDVRRKWFIEYMASLGYHWTPTMLIGQGCKVHMRSNELPCGTIIVMLSKHCSVVIDGVIHDTYDCSRGGTRCVYGYYSKP